MPAYVKQGYFVFESGLEAARELLTLPNPPTAVFASNDDMAAGVLLAAHELGHPGAAAPVGCGLRRHLHFADRLAAADDGASTQLRPRILRDRSAASVAEERRCAENGAAAATS